MKIGVDLDNTLIDYERAFLAAANHLKIHLPPSVQTKPAIREFVRSTQDGELVWQRLQGLAYGNCALAHAKLYPGVKRFLWRCRELGHKVTIVSHKTKYGHHDPEKVPLRAVSSAFLTNQGITDDEGGLVNRVTYHNAYEDKISFIKSQCFDWFIDDLMEVIVDLSEITGLNKVRFHPTRFQNHQDIIDGGMISRVSNWQQIDALINGQWTYQELEKLSYELVQSNATNIDKLTEGGNGGVYRLALNDGRNVKLKIYPVDPDHDRLFSEVMVARGLTGPGRQYIADLIALDFDLGVGVYDWIDGDPVQGVEQIDLQASLSFLEALHTIKNSEQFLDAPVASAACFSGQDIENQINSRILHFNLPRLQYPELDSFFIEIFLPTMRKLISWAKENWPKQDGYTNALTKTERCLSPSDFGFHNAIRRKDGTLAFTDFEYFGWDDPVKLISDFSYHPGMKLSEVQRMFWLNAAINIYGKNLSERLNVCRPLYGMIWCLILLNDFRTEVWERRLLADDTKLFNKNTILVQQLKKAQELLAEITRSYPKVFQKDSHL